MAMPQMPREPTSPPHDPSAIPVAEECQAQLEAALEAVAALQKDRDFEHDACEGALRQFEAEALKSEALAERERRLRKRAKALCVAIGKEHRAKVSGVYYQDILHAANQLRAMLPKA